MLMDTRPASIARVQYTINIFYPKQPAVILLLLCDKNSTIKRTISHCLRKSQNKQAKTAEGNHSFTPKKFNHFYKIWVKYISYAFFKCYMEIVRTCYNSRYDFTQTEFIPALPIFLLSFLEKDESK